MEDLHASFGDVARKRKVSIDRLEQVRWIIACVAQHTQRNHTDKYTVASGVDSISKLEILAIHTVVKFTQIFRIAAFNLSG